MQDHTDGLTPPSGSKPPLATAGPIIKITDLAFAWPAPADFSLCVPSLEIAQGESVLLFGASGGGKSTLLSLICGVLIPQAGSVTIKGTDLDTLGRVARDRFRAERIGVIFQQFNLLPYASVLDNILLPLSFAPERRARLVAKDLSGEQEARNLCDALNLEAIPLTTKAATLSIGQQQRVAVARALIGQPDVIIADEPTSALDTRAQDRFLDLMFAQISEAGGTLLMVSHDERLAHRFDRVLQLADIAHVHRANEGEAA